MVPRCLSPGPGVITVEAAAPRCGPGRGGGAQERCRGRTIVGGRLAPGPMPAGPLALSEDGAPWEGPSPQPRMSERHNTQETESPALRTHRTLPLQGAFGWSGFPTGSPWRAPARPLFPGGPSPLSPAHPRLYVHSAGAPRVGLYLVRLSTGLFRRDGPWAVV